MREYRGKRGAGDDIYAVTQYVAIPVHMDTMITSLYRCCHFGMIMVCCSAQLVGIVECHGISALFLDNMLDYMSFEGQHMESLLFPCLKMGHDLKAPAT